jgi:hypothetical protein
MNDELWRKFKIYIGKYYLYFCLFLFGAIIFPFIIENFNWTTVRYYRAYYATVITLFFATFSFIYQQNKILEDQKKQNEIEQDEENNYYRPLFLVEKTNETNETYGIKEVRLLMKNDSYYLENVQVYGNQNNLLKTESFLRSTNIIISEIDYPFYITGRTMIGETILFGYFYGGERLYKYLKFDKDPYFEEEKNKTDLDLLNKEWGTYNTRTKENNILLDTLLFENTKFLRKKIKQNNLLLFENSFSAKTINGFFNKIFKDLNKYCKYCNSNEIYDSVYKFLLAILVKIKGYDELLSSQDDTPSDIKVYFDSFSEKNHKEIPISAYVNYNKFNTISDFIKYVESYENKDNKKDICNKVINILDNAFEEIVIIFPVETNILTSLKNDIYILEK